jgi:hypothetical protein
MSSFLPVPDGDSSGIEILSARPGRGLPERDD